MFTVLNDPSQVSMRVMNPGEENIQIEEVKNEVFTDLAFSLRKQQRF